MKNNQSQTAIQPRELHRLMNGGQPVQLLDVRTPGEFAAAHVPGAKLIPLDELDAAAFGRESAAEGSPVYVLCQSGGRARHAIEKLERAGVQGCVLVAGGTQAWIDAGAAGEPWREPGASADAPSANHHRGYFRHRRGAGALGESEVCLHSAVYRLRFGVCRRQRLLRPRAFAGKNAME